MRPGRTSELTQTAFLVALAALLFSLAQIPVIGPFLCLGCPFPLTLAVYRQGLRATVPGLLVLGALLGLFQGPLALWGVPLVCTGVLLGVLARARASSLATLGLGGLGLGLFFFGVLFTWENGGAEHLGLRSLHSLAVGRGPQTFEAVADAVAAARGLPRAKFQETPEFRTLTEARKATALLVRGLSWMPLAPALFAGFLGFALYLRVSRPVLDRFGLHLEPLPPLREWTSPWPLAWVAILVVLAECFPRAVAGLEPSVRAPYLALAGSSLRVVLAAYYAVMGMAVVDEFLQRLDTPWPAARAFELIGCLLPMPGGWRGYDLFGLLGLLDPWLQLRDRRPPEGGLRFLDKREDGDDDIDFTL